MLDPPVDCPHRDKPELPGWHLPGYDSLELEDEKSGQDNGIAGAVRVGRMPADAPHGDVKGFRTCGKDPFPVPYLSNGEVGRDMEGKAAVRPSEPCVQSLLNHPDCPRCSLL